MPTRRAVLGTIGAALAAATGGVLVVGQDAGDPKPAQPAAGVNAPSPNAEELLTLLSRELPPDWLETATDEDVERRLGHFLAHLDERGRECLIEAGVLTKPRNGRDGNPLPQRLTKAGRERVQRHGKERVRREEAPR